MNYVAQLRVGAQHVQKGKDLAPPFFWVSTGLIVAYGQTKTLGFKKKTFGLSGPKCFFFNFRAPKCFFTSSQNWSAIHKKAFSSYMQSTPTRSSHTKNIVEVLANKLHHEIWTGETGIHKNLASTQQASSPRRHPLAAKISLCWCCCCFCWGWSKHYRLGRQFQN